jgi:hypothetical protein
MVSFLTFSQKVTRRFGGNALNLFKEKNLAQPRQEEHKNSRAYIENARQLKTLVRKSAMVRCAEKIYSSFQPQ